MKRIWLNRAEKQRLKPYGLSRDGINVLSGGPVFRVTGRTRRPYRIIAAPDRDRPFGGCKYVLLTGTAVLSSHRTLREARLAVVDLDEQADVGWAAS